MIFLLLFMSNIYLYPSVILSNENIMHGVQYNKKCGLTHPPWFTGPRAAGGRGRCPQNQGTLASPALRAELGHLGREPVSWVLSNSSALQPVYLAPTFPLPNLPLQNMEKMLLLSLGRKRISCRKNHAGEPSMLPLRVDWEAWADAAEFDFRP